MAENIWVGKGKDSKYGITMNLCLDDIFAYAKDTIEPAKNGKKYIRLDINKMREVDQYGNEYTVKVNTFVPQPKLEEVRQNEEYADSSELPF